MKNIQCSESDVSFYNAVLNGVPTVTRIAVKDPSKMFFNDPRELSKKPIFHPYQQGNFGFITMEANPAYYYAFMSALTKKANDFITELTSDSKEEKNEEEKPVSEKDPREVTEKVKEFKENNKLNEKYYTERIIVSPATYFYTGKQGILIAEQAGFKELSLDDLLSISYIGDNAKKDAQEHVKDKASDGSPWLSTRYYSTKEGKHEEAVVRLDILLRLGKIGQAEYDEQLYNVDYPPVREYKARENTVEKKTWDSLTKKAYQAAEDFNMYFCLNAINKDGLFGLVTGEK